MKRILVVAAHPDDEAIGIGGTIHRWASEGKSVACLFMADGETSRAGGEARVDGRHSAAERAAAALKYQLLSNLQWPDNRLDQVPLLDLVQSLQTQIDAFAPDTVLTHSASDLNVDHRLTLDAVLTACRPQPGQGVKRLLSYEVASATGWRPWQGTNFEPNFYVSLSEVNWNAKLAALDVYRDEMRDAPHARSLAALDALATFRGSSVGVARAEALSILRWMED